MTAKTIFILGGYGETGRRLAALLMAHTDVALVLAGRRPERAEALAATLNHAHPGDRVRAARADAADGPGLRGALAGADLVLVASSTSAHAGTVARAALDASCDYLDVQISADKLAALRALEGEIAAAGRHFITDGGFHPGMPAAMVRYAAAHFDRLERAHVASVIQIDWNQLRLGRETLDEFVGEFRGYKAHSYRDGRWQGPPWRHWLWPPRFDFGPPFGRRYGFPMFLEEMRALPEQIPGLQETGFSVGGFNWFVDWVMSPLFLAGLWLAPRRSARPLGRLMGWALRTFSRPPYGVVLQLEAAGWRGNHRHEAVLALSQADGYEATAIPVVACLLQWLDGTLAPPGLWLQAQAVEPQRFLADLVRLGYGVEVAGLPAP